MGLHYTQPPKSIELSLQSRIIIIIRTSVVLWTAEEKAQENTDAQFHSESLEIEFYNI